MFVVGAAQAEACAKTLVLTTTLLVNAIFDEPAGPVDCDPWLHFPQMHRTFELIGR